MKMYTTGNVKVDYMAQFQLTGNITPQIWYKTITRNNGKPHLLAIAILSDIVYWYRPVEVRDESTGHLISYEKKFKANILQRSYAQFAELLGESKRSIIDAIIRLEELGVIKRVFQTVEISGTKYNNVLFIDFFPDQLYKLTYPTENDKENNPLTEICDRGYEREEKLLQSVDSEPQVSKKPLSQNYVGEVAKKRSPYHKTKWEGAQNFVTHNTKNTIENNTKNKSSSSEIDDNINKYLEAAQNVCSVEIADAVITELRKHNGKYLSVISTQMFVEICKNITKYASGNITNKSAYIQKCIENIIAGHQLSEANKANRIRAEAQFLNQSYNVVNWGDFEQRVLSN